ncbi:MAG: histidine phosphatase family protein [Candidatus Altiarchaeota archaeon]|nr:histidine phosphatase family protein [Candidatus Altiarchaeota archaeon]
MSHRVLITYFVHGTTTDNEKELATGWNPGKLSELGLAQSKELAEHLKDKQFDVVFSSDLQRAIDSAEIVFGGRFEIKPDARLRECNYGNLNGKPYKLVKLNILNRINTAFPSGESYKDVENRLKEFLDYLAAQCVGKHIAIVAHQGPQLALEVILNNKSWEQAIKEDWRHTGDWQPGWEYAFNF